MQFMQTRGFGAHPLLEEIIRYLSFRRAHLSGNAYYEGDPRFANLSPGLRHRLGDLVYISRLQAVPAFGWIDDDARDREETTIASLFHNADTDQSDQLDKDEIRKLIQELHLTVSDDQFEELFDEIDADHTGEISLQGFSNWWFVTKYGQPRLAVGSKCVIHTTFVWPLL